MAFLKSIMLIALFTMNCFQYYRCHKARIKIEAMEAHVENGTD